MAHLKQKISKSPTPQSHTKRIGESAIELTPRNHWCPQPDLNRCCRRERPVSLARLDDGDDIDLKGTIFSEKGMIIKPRNNPKVNRQLGRGFSCFRRIEKVQYH